MNEQHHSGFVRVPTIALENLLRHRLSGVQWRIVLWALRHTFGWNRSTTPFSWYRIAQDIRADRSGVFRAGKYLIRESVLFIENGRIGVTGSKGPTSFDDGDQPSMPPVNAPNDAGPQPYRGRASSLFRRAKDRCIDINTKERKVNQKKERQASPQGGAYHPAGAAHPVPGKYDNVSEH